MARALEFVYEGKSFSCTINKIDRSKLYGSVDVETRDKSGYKCQLATLASDGHTLIPSGGVGFGYFTQDGERMDRAELVPVDASGNRLNSVASSFNHPIDLEMRVTPERFLDHSIRSAYALDAEDLPSALLKELEGGAIYKIDFSYRGGVNVDPAFFTRGADGTVWLLIGVENNVNFVSFTQAAAMVPDDAEETDADDLDFEMF
jgi:hypothetical protein